jgi:hypothetical protein
MCSITSKFSTIFVQNHKRVPLEDFEFKIDWYGKTIYFVVYRENALWFYLQSELKYCEFTLNDDANRVCGFNLDKFILRDVIFNIDREYDLPFNGPLNVKKKDICSLFLRDSTLNILVSMGRYFIDNYEISYYLTDQLKYRSKLNIDDKFMIYINYDDYSIYIYNIV